jgi:hypothetical protein
MKHLSSASCLLLLLRPVMLSSYVTPACCRRGCRRRRLAAEQNHWWERPLSANGSLSSSCSNNSTSTTSSSVVLVDDKEKDVVDTSATATTTTSSESSLFGQNLTFRSTFEAWSDPLPNHVARQALISFYDDPSHFSFGPSIPSTIISITPELYQEWSQACQRAGATNLPALDGNDKNNLNGSSHHLQRILSVQAARFSMLGLTVEWSAWMGAQVVQRQDASSLPYIEFVLIKDQSEARGTNKPLVWMYNKITGSSSSNNNNNNNNKQETVSAKPQRETIFLSRFGFAETVDRQRRDLMFQCTGTMEMLFPIPSMVGRMMIGPSSAKMQQQVNRVITREIEKDMKKAMRHWEENFRRWADTMESGTRK